MSLRQLTQNDLFLVLSWRNSPEVREHMYTTHKISEAEHRAWFAKVEQDQQSRWYIHEDDTGNADGVVYFTQYRPENRSSFWGFYTSPESAVGTGTRIGLDALNEAFSVLNLHKLNAEVISTNRRSLRFHEKLGFSREGCFRDYHFDGYDYVDVIRFGILSSEWLKKRSEIEHHIASYETN